MAIRTAITAALALACVASASGVAQADQQIVATVGQSSTPDAVSVSALGSCPTYTGPQIEEYGAGGVLEPETESGAASAWALGTIISQCLPTPVPAASVVAVVVVGADGPEAPLSPADLQIPSDFSNPQETPVIYSDGDNLDYVRPWRGGADANADDDVQVQSPDPFQLEVFTGPLLQVTLSAPSSAQPGTAVDFAASVAGAPAGLTYSWTFDGGGGNTTAADPAVTFPAAGVYRVAVEVTDSAGGGGVASTTVTVGAPAQATATTPTPGAGTTSGPGTGTSTTTVAGGGSTASPPPKRRPRPHHRRRKAPAPTQVTSTAGAPPRRTSTASAPPTRTSTASAPPKRTSTASAPPATTTQATPPPASHAAPPVRGTASPAPAGPHATATPAPKTTASKPPSAAPHVDVAAAPHTRSAAHGQPRARRVSTHARRASNSPSKPASPRGKTSRVDGRLIAGIAPVALDQSPLASAGAGSATGSQVPRRTQPGSAATLTAAGVALLLLFGLGAAREADWRRIRSAP